jgi:hypothetical protein
MSASIHINGTESSIVDTVFVCRSGGTVSRQTLVFTPREIARLVSRDAEALAAGSVKVTRGDMRCIAYGHLIRLAIWELRKEWSRGLPTAKKLEAVASGGAAHRR